MEESSFTISIVEHKYHLNHFITVSKNILSFDGFPPPDDTRAAFPECRKGSGYSKELLFICLARKNKGLTELSPEKFGELIRKAYSNYSKEIHDGKRSSKEVTASGDKIIINESSLVDYEQCKCIKELADYYKYSFELRLNSQGYL